MKKIFFLLLIWLVSVETNAQNIFKGILLRSKEKMEWTETIFPEMDDDVIRSFDSSEVKDTTMYGYYECVLTLDLDCATEAYSYINNPDVQADLVKVFTTTYFLSDSLVRVMANYVKDEITFDNVCEKLRNLEEYDSYFFNNHEDLIKEMSKYSDSRQSTKTTKMSLWVNNGLLYSGRNFDNVISIYDTETGKRIEPLDLFNTLTVTNLRGDTVTLTKISEITKGLINDQFYLTPYAKKLMEKSKSYYSRTNENQYGDLIRTYCFGSKDLPNFLKELASTDLDATDTPTDTREVFFPYKLNGCKNTEKIRNRMFDVMFGKHDGDVDSLIFNSVNSMMKDKPWMEYETLLEIGDGLVSFGYENSRARSNLDNHFIVFDKTTGNEITPQDLIKDKKGFIDYVKSFNFYMAGFLFDTIQLKNDNLDPKFQGEEFRSYVRNNLRHAMSRAQVFNGLDEFPTMWWFPFNQFDNVLVPVEFDTKTMRVFLDYYDIRKFINPKYRSVMDAAAACALKKKRNDD